MASGRETSFFFRQSSIASICLGCTRTNCGWPLPVVFGRPRDFLISFFDWAMNSRYQKNEPRGSTATAILVQGASGQRIGMQRGDSTGGPSEPSNRRALVRAREPVDHAGEFPPTKLVYQRFCHSGGSPWSGVARRMSSGNVVRRATHQNPSVGWVDPRPNWSEVVDFNKSASS